MQITSFGQYPKYAVGGLCTQGKAPTVHQIRGDGNCYFRAISYSICGEKRYYAAIRTAVCDFISMFNGDLKPFLTRGKGKEYIQKSQDEKEYNMGIRDRNSGHSKDTPQSCVHLPQFQMAEISIQTQAVCGSTLPG